MAEYVTPNGCSSIYNCLFQKVTVEVARAATKGKYPSCAVLNEAKKLLTESGAFDVLEEVVEAIKDALPS